MFRVFGFMFMHEVGFSMLSKLLGSLFNMSTKAKLNCIVQIFNILRYYFCLPILALTKRNLLKISTVIVDFSFP